MRIGLLSDTHGFLDDQIFAYFADCDEIWHAGDIGSLVVSEQLSAFKPFEAVYGNIDGADIRARYPEDLWLEREGIRVWITHIGGYPPRYNPRVRQVLAERQPDLMVCGHSHILKVVRDPKRHPMLCLNPGAAGRHGFHQIRTLLRFTIKNGQVGDMEVIELGKRSLPGRWQKRGDDR